LGWRKWRRTSRAVVVGEWCGGAVEELTVADGRGCCSRSGADILVFLFSSSLAFRGEMLSCSFVLFLFAKWLYGVVGGMSSLYLLVRCRPAYETIRPAPNKDSK
jgi:hypothetical protein